MTDEEWQHCTSPFEMMEAMRNTGRANKRKVCLFGAACCRSLGDLISKKERQVIELVERYLDGQCEREALRGFDPNPVPVDEWAGEETAEIWARGGVHHLLWLAYQEQLASPEEMQSAWMQQAGRVAGWARQAECLRVEEEHPAGGDSGDRVQAALDRQVQAECHFLRDVFGNPSRPTSIDPAVLAWNDGTVVKIARAIYDERNFADLPILADALADAGCADEAIQAHCREGGEHIPGCWVLDLVLNQDKEWSTPSEVTQVVVDYGRAALAASTMGFLQQSVERYEAEAEKRINTATAVVLFALVGAVVLGCFVWRGPSPKPHSVSPVLRGDYLDRIKPVQAKPITITTFREPPELLPPPGQEED